MGTNLTPNTTHKNLQVDAFRLIYILIISRKTWQIYVNINVQHSNKYQVDLNCWWIISKRW